MTTIRKISNIIEGKRTSDGAGVSLLRIFGFYEEGLFDPFLLLDFFGSENPQEYMAGFPWHPHRGMETVTYMLEGSVEHGDSMGNSGVIHTGDVQWMTAGSGIIHQEMPKSDKGHMHGFQLWVNLPASQKMMPPRYQEIRAAEIPVVDAGNGISIKVIAGELNGTKGPVKEIVADPEYLDISMPASSSYSMSVHPGHTVFAFVYEGEVSFDQDHPAISKGHVVKFTDGDTVNITTQSKNAKLILVAGKPLNEKVAWRGPIVMNTDAELDTAFREFRNGTFVK